MDFEDFYGRYVDRVASYVLRHTSVREAPGDRTVTRAKSVLSPGLAGEPGVEAYWMDIENVRLMVATSGDLDAVALKVPTFWRSPRRA